MAIIFDDMGNEMYDDGGMSFPTSVNYDSSSTGGIFSNPDYSIYEDPIDQTKYGYGSTTGDFSGYLDNSQFVPDPMTDYSYGGANPAPLGQGDEIPNTATKPGETGYGWKYYSDGMAISPEGKVFYQNKLLSDPTTNTGALFNKLGDAGINALKSAFTKKDAQGNTVTDWRQIAGVAGGVLGLSGLLGGGSKGSSQPQGYQGGIPKYTAVRSAVPITGEQPKAGDPGRRYFSDQIYATADNVGKAQADMLSQAQGLAALQQIEKKPLPSTAPTPTPSVVEANKVATDENKPTTGLAAGGIASLNAKNGMYLGGPTDGMADKLPATIDGNQEAALSHGEFVIPADVVGHLGNGNSEAGAERLYSMMDKVRMARTGNPKQGKQINPNKFLPA